MEPSSEVLEGVTQAPLTAADRELGYRLGAVILRCMSADGGTAIRVIDESGLTFTQTKVLMTLSGIVDKPSTLKPLAEKLGLSLPSASRAVDELVNRDLVARIEDEHDRRQKRLSLTPAGEQLSQRVVAARIEGLGQFAASLTDTERERLDGALALLLERDEIAAVYRQYKKAATP